MPPTPINQPRSSARSHQCGIAVELVQNDPEPHPARRQHRRGHLPPHSLMNHNRQIAAAPVRSDARNWSAVRGLFSARPVVVESRSPQSRPARLRSISSVSDAKVSSDHSSALTRMQAQRVANERISFAQAPSVVVHRAGLIANVDHRRTRQRHLASSMIASRSPENCGSSRWAWVSMYVGGGHLTVTLFARLRGLSGSLPRSSAA